MVIRDLKPSQHAQGRWLALLEDGSILRLGEGEVVGFSLYTGMELDGETLEKLQQSARRSGLKEKAINLLSAKPMSRRELEKKLQSWQADEEESRELCQRLEELGFLNDGRYAELVVRHYSAKGYGVRRLRDELYRRGVPRELWDDALEQAEDPEQAIDDFLRKKLSDPEDPKQVKRVTDALARRGFGWREIGEGLRRLGMDVED